jgi:hypothetical protein
MQITELHYRRQPTCDHVAVKARAQEILKSELDSTDVAETDKAFLVFHKQHTVEYAEGRLPAQTAILSADKPPNPDVYLPEVQQSWRCPGAADLMRGAVATRLVTEMMATRLPPRERVSIYHGVLRAMIEVTAPDALVFKHSQQIVSPANYLKDCSQDPIYRSGSLNVRFFKISNSDGDMIMDTRGLDAIGLPDLQCHFRRLDANGVARVLFNTAVYIFENGVVIETGHTIEGIEPGSKWHCQFENSLLEPKRNVLDLNPGKPYAAGNR